MTTTSPVNLLTRPEGRIAYEVAGQGPLVVLVPGMGDLRSTYRYLAPELVQAGYRVASVDLRGHGDSDTTFTDLGDAATGSDVLALVSELGGPAVVIGNSMGAGAAAWAAAERPGLVRGLVLVGPFVRDAATSTLQRLMLRLAMVPLWAAASWKSYLPKLYAGRKPDDFDTHRRNVVASLKRPGHAVAFSATTRISHRETAARLDDVSAPTLVVMGELDPDFPSPAVEAAWIADALDGEVLLVPDAGHYPQSQRPDLVTPAVLGFLRQLGPVAGDA
ncbi:MAG: alpha/beta hydrolase [Actinomycetes bacterium]